MRERLERMTNPGYSRLVEVIDCGCLLRFEIPWQYWMHPDGEVHPYLDFNQDMNLEPLFQEFLKNEFSQIQRTFRIIRNYEQNNPLVEYLISEDAHHPNLLDGFFEIIGVSGQMAEVEDIHLKTRVKPVDKADKSPDELIVATAGSVEDQI